MDLIEFWTLCSSNGIILEEKQLRQIERYRGELLYWNKKVNLISRKDEERTLENHILHSLTILKYIDLPTKARCIDAGSGGGLPGVPLAIARPGVDMLLVDSIAKKIKITKMLANHTGLRRLQTLNARVEEMKDHKAYLRKFDFVFARALAKTTSIISWTKELIKDDAKIVLLKGGNLEEEIKNAKKFHKNIDIKEINISFLGYEAFAREEKKILICKFKK